MKVKFILLTGAFLLLCSNLKAQRIQVDSLRQEISKHGPSADRYVETANAYLNQNLDSVVWFCKEALKLKPSDYALMKAETLLGEIEGEHGNTSKAHEHLKKALELARKQKDQEEIHDILCIIGTIYNKEDDFENACKCYEEVLEYAIHHDPALAFNTYLNLASLNSHIGHYEEAITFVKNAEKYQDSAPLAERVIRYASLGTLQYNIKKYPEAEASLRKGWQLSQQYKEPLAGIRCINALISLLSQMPKRQKEVPALIDEATRTIMAVAPEGSDRMQLEHAKVNYYMAVRNWSKGLTSARYLYTRGPAVSSTRDQIMLMMASCLEGLGKTDSACYFYREAYYIGDSIRNMQINAQMADATARYDAKEKELKILGLEKNAAIADARYWRMTGGVILLLALLLLAALGFLYWRKQQKRKMQLIEAQQYIDGLESERKRLAQELHDGVCNDLLVTAMKLSSDASIENASKQIYEVRETVRNISHELMPPNMKFVTLDLTLMAYTYKLSEMEQFEIDFKATPLPDWSFIPENVSYNLYRMVQELTANIIQHSKPSHIHIALTVTPQRQLSLVITDDAPETDTTHKSSGNGIGLRSITERSKSIGATVSISTDEEKRRHTCITVKDVIPDSLTLDQEQA